MNFSDPSIIYIPIHYCRFIRNKRSISGKRGKLLKIKLYSRNLIKEINTWTVPLIRYSGPFLRWTREELKQIDQRKRKLMTMNKALNRGDEIDRLFVSRKEGIRRLASMEDCVIASIQQLEDCGEKYGGKLITATRNNTDETWIS